MDSMGSIILGIILGVVTFYVMKDLAGLGMLLSVILAVVVFILEGWRSYLHRTL